MICTHLLIGRRKCPTTVFPISLSLSLLPSPFESFLGAAISVDSSCNSWNIFNSFPFLSASYTLRTRFLILSSTQNLSHCQRTTAVFLGKCDLERVHRNLNKEHLY
ncbi:hypothetical protein DM860_003061 [Cuscuta australis]|uniref:Uncharacterized protein n=1 Tax=Cuscuta australis TaxID=267555 RepID=A0A328D503_9ASTE|nr:hypothetical protein DM860_003061 [Cuscuta australis]